MITLIESNRHLQHLCKVDASTLKHTLISKWYMVGCESKNGHQNDVCRKEIGLPTQNSVTILDIMINMIGGSCVIIPSLH